MQSAKGNVGLTIHAWRRLNRGEVRRKSEWYEYDTMQQDNHSNISIFNGNDETTIVGLFLLTMSSALGGTIFPTAVLPVEPIMSPVLLWNNKTLWGYNF